VPVPGTVEGIDFSPAVTGSGPVDQEAVLIASYSPFSDWRPEKGGREYRGVRTRRHTYVRDLTGPWLLFDNERDPHQTLNLVNSPDYAELQAELDGALTDVLRRQNDAFEPARVLRKRYAYPDVDAMGNVPYTK